MEKDLSLQQSVISIMIVPQVWPTANSPQYGPCDVQYVSHHSILYIYVGPIMNLLQVPIYQTKHLLLRGIEVDC